MHAIQCNLEDSFALQQICVAYEDGHLHYNPVGSHVCYMCSVMMLCYLYAGWHDEDEMDCMCTLNNSCP